MAKSIRIQCGGDPYLRWNNKKHTENSGIKDRRKHEKPNWIEMFFNFTRSHTFHLWIYNYIVCQLKHIELDCEYFVRPMVWYTCSNCTAKLCWSVRSPTNDILVFFSRAHFSFLCVSVPLSLSLSLSLSFSLFLSLSLPLLALYRSILLSRRIQKINVVCRDLTTYQAATTTKTHVMLKHGMRKCRFYAHTKITNFVHQFTWDRTIVHWIPLVPITV